MSTPYRVTVSFEPVDLAPGAVEQILAGLPGGDLLHGSGLVTSVEVSVEAASVLAAIEQGTAQVLAVWREAVDDHEPMAISAVTQSTQLTQL